MRQIKSQHLVFLFLAILPGALSAQEKIDFGHQKIKFFSENFSVPPYFARQTQTTQSVFIEREKVIKREYRVIKSVFVQTKSCSEVAGTQIPRIDADQIFRVKSVWSYEFKKKIFAYEIEYEFFNRSTGDEIGATTSVFYIDEKGRGKFRITCVPDFELKYVPKWLRQPIKK